MKSLNLRLCSTLATLALAGSAESHGISGDDWVDSGAGGTGTSVVVTHAVLPGQTSLAGITSLSFSPGTTMAPYEIFSQLPNCALGFECFAGAQYNWSGGGGEETVDLIAGYSTSPASVDPLPTAAPLTSAHYNGPFNDLPVLTVLFGYGYPDQACDSFSGQTASLTVNNVTYKATNPCSLKGVPGPNPPFLTAGAGDLTFINGVLQAGTGVGWTKSTAVAAPEIDPGSSASALTLFLGSVLVLRARTSARKKQSVARERSVVLER